MKNEQVLFIKPLKTRGRKEGGGKGEGDVKESEVGAKRRKSRGLERLGFNFLVRFDFRS